VKVEIKMLIGEHVGVHKVDSHRIE